MSVLTVGCSRRRLAMSGFPCMAARISGVLSTKHTHICKITTVNVDVCGYLFHIMLQELSNKLLLIHVYVYMYMNVCVPSLGVKLVDITVLLKH